MDIEDPDQKPVMVKVEPEFLPNETDETEDYLTGVSKTKPPFSTTRNVPLSTEWVKEEKMECDRPTEGVSETKPTTNTNHNVPHSAVWIKEEPTEYIHPVEDLLDAEHSAWAEKDAFASLKESSATFMETTVRLKCNLPEISYPNSSFNTINASNINNEEHSVNHIQNRLFPCAQCSAKFLRNSQLRRHLLVHTEKKEFSCDQCYAQFRRKSNLQEHLLTHTQEKAYSCAECSAQFKRKSGLVRHSRTHKMDSQEHISTKFDGKTISCDQCSAQFKTNHTLRKHQLTHTKERVFSCDQCSALFKTNETLRNHLRTHFKEDAFSGNLDCKDGFRMDLVTHIQDEALPSRPFSACLKVAEMPEKVAVKLKDSCTEETNISGGVTEVVTVKSEDVHLEGTNASNCIRSEEHKELKLRSMSLNTCDFSPHFKNEGIQYTKILADGACIKTENKSDYENTETEFLKSPSQENCSQTLNFNFGASNGTMSSASSLCGNSGLLQNNIRTPQSSTENMSDRGLDAGALCTSAFCKKSFSLPDSPLSVIVDSVTHSQNRPFSCSHCSATFQLNSLLKKHLLSHTEERAFSCDQCSAQFKRKFHLREHLLTHTDERPFSCEQCSLQFKRKSCLARHLRTHNKGSLKHTVCIRNDLRGLFQENNISCDLQGTGLHGKEDVRMHLRTHIQDEAFCSNRYLTDISEKDNMKSEDIDLEESNTSNDFNHSESGKDLRPTSMSLNTYDLSPHSEEKRSQFTKILADNAGMKTERDSDCENAVTRSSKSPLQENCFQPFELDVGLTSKSAVCGNSDRSQNNFGAPQSSTKNMSNRVVSGELFTSACSASSPTDQCSAQFKRKYNLQEHLVTHTQEKAYSCGQCSAKFRHNSQLRTHLIVHIEERAFSCDQCSAQFKRKSHLQEHLLIHFPEKSFLCKHCSAQFKRKNQLVRHLLTHTKEKTLFSCNDCPAWFERKSDFSKHIRIHNQEGAFSCNQCSARFNFKETLRKHVRVHKDRILSCDLHGADSKCKGAIKTNLVTHIQDKAFSAGQCSVGLVNKVSVKSEEGHFEETNASSYPSVLEVHKKLKNSRMERRNGIDEGKKFACDQCSARFKRNSCLQRHLLTHSQEKPVSCDQCSARFRNKDDLRNHSFSHSHERKFSCDQCSTKFKRKKTLIKHYLSHSEKGEFSCDQCLSKFKHKYNLAAHLRKHKRFSLKDRVLSCDLHGANANCKEAIETNLETHIQDKAFSAGECSAGLAEKVSVKLEDLEETNASSYSSVLEADKKLMDSKMNRRNKIDEGRKYSCDQCSARFKRNSCLRRHLLTHSQEKPVSCDQCSARFRNKDDLRKHSLSHSHERKFTCDQCSAQFKCKKVLKKHYLSHSEKGEFSCDQCSAQFKHKCSLTAHLRKHKRFSLKDKILSCDLPGVNANCKETIETNLETHIQDKAFSAGECSAGLAEKVSVKLEETYASSYSSVLEADKKLMDSKMNRRNKIDEGRKYSCDQCSARFKRNSCLRRHLLTHSQEKPVSCDQCSARFWNKDGLRNHSFSHSHERKFSCDQCFAQFKCKKVLKKHYLSHSEKGEFSCDQCSAQFKHQCSLTAHLKNHKRFPQSSPKDNSDSVAIVQEHSVPSSSIDPFMFVDCSVNIKNENLSECDNVYSYIIDEYS